MEAIKGILLEAWLCFARLFFWKRRYARFVVLLGGPGAGKGTIAAMLTAKLGLPQLNTGNILRREIEQNTEVGQLIKGYLKNGQLAPEYLVMKVVRQELSKPEYIHGAILDGIPRRASQAKKLRRMLAFWGAKVNRAVLIEVPEEDLIERLSLRKTCSNKDCGHTFHEKFLPARCEGICDHCGSTLERRPDDNPEVIKKRFKVFKEEFGPVCDFYQRSQRLTICQSSNAMRPQQVCEQILFAIEQSD